MVDKGVIEEKLERVIHRVDGKKYRTSIYVICGDNTYTLNLKTKFKGEDLEGIVSFYIERRGSVLNFEVGGSEYLLEKLDMYKARNLIKKLYKSVNELCNGEVMSGLSKVLLYLYRISKDKDLASEIKRHRNTYFKRLYSETNLAFRIKARRENLPLVI
ncbi:MAG: hypothetical protein BXU00_00890 [Candidatus Nanoclepta minutus]|uniref:Uncharacterized protein n=1 Tax=Candidatus Nanoclepta minutus TaxID=1940235 RepID=A0A397WNZ5_9ARCH|nr:MAG: hypothetical protein BXU00_00890 [Candidatus Nanoclepta minutus]